jgi:ribosome-associated toxin RatA of RatAB toxin-antitoxin module
LFRFFSHSRYHPGFFLVLFLLFQGCSTKYTLPSSKYPQYWGEVNQHTRLIKAKNHKIFRLLIHEETFKTICPKGTIVTYESVLPYQVGTLVKTKIDHIFKLEWRSRVVELVPDKIIRLQFLDGFFAGGTEIWEFEREGEFTKATHTIIVKPKGFFKKLAWSLKVRHKHNKMIEAFLDDLKNIAETGAI